MGELPVLVNTLLLDVIYPNLALVIVLCIVSEYGNPENAVSDAATHTERLQ